MRKANENLTNVEKLQAVNNAFGTDTKLSTGLLELFGAIEHLEAWCKRTRVTNKRYSATKGSVVSVQRTFNKEFDRIMQKYDAAQKANDKAARLLARKEKLIAQLNAVEEKLNA